MSLLSHLRHLYYLLGSQPCSLITTSFVISSTLSVLSPQLLTRRALFSASCTCGRRDRVLGLWTDRWLREDPATNTSGPQTHWTSINALHPARPDHPHAHPSTHPSTPGFPGQPFLPEQQTSSCVFAIGSQSIVYFTPQPSHCPSRNEAARCHGTASRRKTLQSTKTLSTVRNISHYLLHAAQRTAFHASPILETAPHNSHGATALSSPAA